MSKKLWIGTRFINLRNKIIVGKNTFDRTTVVNRIEIQGLRCVKIPFLKIYNLQWGFNGTVPVIPA